uniref:CRAL-TRIO domain-containing protein n=1 Tax=Amphora coffeiformis TaxID=265554 RepID=A0A7S3L039_9STRA|mmetsp:Transcript_5782/g.11773  ORF Transcript_5782/g.11773 Transcript_5782/m.11773 type:complete len:459 (+) Transcript_5782:255-1631(+)
MSPQDEYLKDGKTETSSYGSLSDNSGSSSQKKRKSRVKRLIQKLSFERGPTTPPQYSVKAPITIPSTESGLTTHSFGSTDYNKEDPITPTHVIPVLHGTVDPEGEVEVIFYDAHQDGDDNSQTFHGKFQRESIVLSHIQRGGGTNPYYVEVDTDQSGHGDEELSYPYHPASPLGDTDPPKEVTLDNQSNLPPKVIPPPLPPKELPLRFLRAGKGDPKEGLRRYEETLQWRKEEKVDLILREANPNFDAIKQYYKHYCHGKGKNGEPCYYEQPPKTNLKALREAGVGLETLLRHYVQVAEFQWQFLERDDLRNSIYIIDLEGMRFGDFVGEVVDFVKRASKLSNLHYPERAGYVFVINVPSWFKLIWNVVKQWVDPVTLEKISILRGKEEIMRNMELRIPLDQLPPEYGGQSAPLGQSEQEKTLRELIMHNNAIAAGNYTCGGVKRGCRFCNFTPARAY